MSTKLSCAARWLSRSTLLGLFLLSVQTLPASGLAKARQGSEHCLDYTDSPTSDEPSHAVASCADSPNCKHDDKCSHTQKAAKAKRLCYRNETRYRTRIVHEHVGEVVYVPETYTDYVYHTDTRLVPRPVAHTVNRLEVRPWSEMAPVAERRDVRMVRVWYPVAEMACVAVDYGHYDYLPCLGNPCEHCRKGCPLMGAIGRSFTPNYTGLGGCGRSCGGAGYAVRPKFFVSPYAPSCNGCSRGCQACSPCGHSGGCQARLHRIWKPDIQLVTRPVVRMACFERPELSEPVRIVQPVTHLNVLPVRDYEIENRLEPRTTTRRMPVTRTRMVPRTVYHVRAKKVKEAYVVKVPYTVEDEVHEACSDCHRE